MKEKVNILKWIGPQKNLLLSFLFFFNTFFWRFKSSSGSKWFILVFPSAFFFSFDCFDRVMVLISSRIYVCECPVRVNCPWKTFVSAEVVSHILFFFFTRVYTVCLWVYVGLRFHVCVYIFGGFSIYISKQVSWPTVVKGNPKVPFSIATTPKGRKGRYSFPSIAPQLICTLECWVLSNETSSTIFKVFGMTRPRIELRSPGLLVNTLLMGRLHELIRHIFPKMSKKKKKKSHPDSYKDKG